MLGFLLVYCHPVCTRGEVRRRRRGQQWTARRLSPCIVLIRMVYCRLVPATKQKAKRENGKTQLAKASVIFLA